MRPFKPIISQPNKHADLIPRRLCVVAALNVVTIGVSTIGITIMRAAVELAIRVSMLLLLSVCVAHGVVHLILHGRPIARIVLRVDGRDEVDEEGEDVECEDKGYRPLEDGSCVVGLSEVADGESCDVISMTSVELCRVVLTNCKCQIHQDEEQLQPEGLRQDLVSAVVDAQALILGTDEDGRDQVARDEQEQEDVV